MKELNINDFAPDFKLLDKEEKEYNLAQFKGRRWVVLYFYPKDDTEGCTMEAIDFTKTLEKFEAVNTQVIGISPDTCESHEKFSVKYALKVLLLSDTEHKVLEKYGVWKLKKMYGREYYGVERSTFLINPEGKIVHIWRKVQVIGHIEEVLQKRIELGK